MQKLIKNSRKSWMQKMLNFHQPIFQAAPGNSWTLSCQLNQKEMQESQLTQSFLLTDTGIESKLHHAVLFSLSCFVLPFKVYL